MVQFHNGDWWSVELNRMIEEQIPEDLHLDYKEQRSLLPSSRGSSGIDKQKRADDVSKDVSSFLNSDGGVLVYGVPEMSEPNVTGGTPIPSGLGVGFQRDEIGKETIENLITGNIQPKPGPDLFRVTEVPYGDEGRVAFVVEVAVGVGGVWQARDKRYYRRFQFKAEPMEHYEIELVRSRSFGPDVRVVFGVNDRWATSLSNLEYLSRREQEVQIHVGIQNVGNAVADSALIELGLWPNTNCDAMMKIYQGEFPDGIFPPVFKPVGIRNIKWEGARFQLPIDGLPVVWSQLFWNGSNRELAGSYAPIFKTESPLPVATLNMKGVTVTHSVPRVFAFCFWRVQASNMQPKEGILEVSSPEDSSGIPSLPCIKMEHMKLEIT